MKKCKNSNNYDLGKTKITDKIRVSSAALFRHEWFGMRYQVETWCFSDDIRQGSIHVIHGSDSISDPETDEPSDYLVNKAEKIHQHISNNLKQRYCNG